MIIMTIIMVTITNNDNTNNSNKYTVAKFWIPRQAMCLFAWQRESHRRDRQQQASTGGNRGD